MDIVLADTLLSASAIATVGIVPLIIIIVRASRSRPPTRPDTAPQPDSAPLPVEALLPYTGPAAVDPDRTEEIQRVRTQPLDLPVGGTR